jgi:hypothetical protein
MTPAQAFATLGLRSTATAAEVKDAYRKLASTAHPDHGGDADRMAHLNDAYVVATAEAEKPVRCATCDGRGRIMATGFKTGSFVAPMVRCSVCKGTGKVKRDASAEESVKRTCVDDYARSAYVKDLGFDPAQVRAAMLSFKMWYMQRSETRAYPSWLNEVEQWLDEVEKKRG